MHKYVPKNNYEIEYKKSDIYKSATIQHGLKFHSPAFTSLTMFLNNIFCIFCFFIFTSGAWSVVLLDRLHTNLMHARLDLKGIKVIEAFRE